ncbi:MAG TPA: hypothetical protein VFQ30_18455 [Ktedonobacteraceae bacterium]|nr:hypothetical protein [Ktedonobacteraceae bacterium]
MENKKHGSLLFVSVVYRAEGVSGDRKRRANQTPGCVRFSVVVVTVPVPGAVLGLASFAQYLRW